MSIDKSFTYGWAVVLTCSNGFGSRVFKNIELLRIGSIMVSKK